MIKDRNFKDVTSRRDKEEVAKIHRKIQKKKAFMTWITMRVWSLA